MKFRMRNRIPLGPFYIHFSQGRFTSWGIRVRLGPLGAFTKNATTGKWSWNSPGPGAFSGGGRK